MLPIAGRLATEKVMYLPLFFHFYRTLPVVTPNCSFTKFVHHPGKSAGRSFYLCFIDMSASEFLSDFVMSGGGGCGGHTYSVLCTVWATLGPGCSVVYMGHSCCYCLYRPRDTV